MNVKTQGTQKEAQIVDIAPKTRPTMHYRVDFDTTNPGRKIREFVADIKEMLSTYEHNRARIITIEQELNDLEHFIEIAPFQSAPNGYKLYKKIAELRRERRACKNENDLLQAVYDYFHATQVLDKLSSVQGAVASADAVVKSRCFQVRTDVLDEFMSDEKQEQIGLNLLTGETCVM